jgi:hypothetical protein
LLISLDPCGDNEERKQKKDVNNRHLGIFFTFAIFLQDMTDTGQQVSSLPQQVKRYSFCTSLKSWHNVSLENYFKKEIVFSIKWSF